MRRYGVPYIGSKSAIAEEILSFLPPGRRFVDLFGGGFAMSHAALFADTKYDEVLYNDINPLMVPFLERCFHGFYGEGFHPEWISRERFNDLKMEDAYVALCWSFANDGWTYLYGTDVEETKKQVFEYIVNGTRPDFPCPELTGGVAPEKVGMDAEDQEHGTCSSCLCRESATSGDA